MPSMQAAMAVLTRHSKTWLSGRVKGSRQLITLRPRETVHFFRLGRADGRATDVTNMRFWSIS